MLFSTSNLLYVSDFVALVPFYLHVIFALYIYQLPIQPALVLNFTWWVQWVVIYTCKQVSILAVIYQGLQYCRVFSYLQLASRNKKHAVVFSFWKEKVVLQFIGVCWKFLEFLYLLFMFWVSSIIKCNLITCSSICPDYLCSCNKKSRKL